MDTDPAMGEKTDRLSTTNGGSDDGDDGTKALVTSKIGKRKSKADLFNNIGSFAWLQWL
jgi:hypothetical protein